MKPVVVFLVKNGIGYGHLRRALILAEAMQADGSARPVIISQASSIDLLCTTRVSVVNFPLIQHLPNDIAADWYTDVLDALLDRLDPAVVVEDTYPDPRYLSLPALRDRPRALVLRRLDGLSFDTIRSAGRFAAYEKVLVAQNPDAFAQEGHSGETLTAVQLSGRFTFVGEIYRTPDPATVAQLRAGYCHDSQRLVVVNGGAGGDQMPDGYGDRLFHACDRVADRLHGDGIAVHFVFVTGPYYVGRPIRERTMVTVRRFEPLLPELVAAADVAVIKPGHNAVSEALCGGAQLILVPDVSFMEGLDEHSQRIATQYGGAVAAPDADRLELLVREMLHKPARITQLPSCEAAIGQIVDTLATMATAKAPIAIAARRLVLLLKTPATLTAEAMLALLPAELAGAQVIDAHVPHLAGIESGHTGHGLALVVEAPPSLPDRAVLVADGIRLLIGHQDDPAFLRWSKLPVPGPATITAPMTTVIADPARPHRLYRHLRQVTTQHEMPIIQLDLRRLASPDELGAYLDEVANWLAQQPLQLLSASDAARYLAQGLVEAL